MSFEEAKEKWLKRLKRINYNNYFFEFYTSNIKMAEAFDSLPNKKKIVFVPYKCNLASAIELNALQESLNKIYKNEFFKLINALAISKCKYYDTIKLLCGDSDYKRIE
jgi:uncharacterized protein (DUF1919 family)